MDETNHSTPENTIPVTHASLSPIQPAPNHKSKLLPILSFLLVVALIATGFFAYKYYLSQPNQNIDQVACTLDAKICPDGSSVGRSGPNCEFAPCPSANLYPEPDGSGAIANWQTYISKEHNFSLRYPPDWSQVGHVSSTDSTLSYFYAPEPKPISPDGLTPPQYFIYIETTGSLPEYNYTPETLGTADQVYQVFKTSDKPSRSGALTYYIEIDSQFISISFTPYLNPNPYYQQEEFVEIFDQILSTLQFSESLTNTKEWKTFIHPQNLFSFSYPSEGFDLNNRSLVEYMQSVNNPNLAKDFQDRFNVAPPELESLISAQTTPPENAYEYVSPDNFVVTTLQNPNQLTATEWYNTFQYFPHQFGYYAEGYEPFPDKDIIVSDFPGKYTDYSITIPERKILIPKGEYLFLIAYRLNSTTSSTIFSTFQFTN